MEEEFIKLGEIKNFNTNIPGNILSEMQLFSSYRVKCKKNNSQIIQQFYVPKEEYEFYKSWKEKVIRELIESKQNAVLIQSIARRHGF